MEVQNKTCPLCSTDLDEVREEMEGESPEDILNAVNDCTEHDPNFDPTDYKTWPRDYLGTLIDRAKDLRD